MSLVRTAAAPHYIIFIVVLVLVVVVLVSIVCSCDSLFFCLIDCSLISK